MPADAEFCAECGAPLSDAPGVGGSDAEVYPELAKANLARMRKEWKQAEDICLAILRRFPNNLSANTLLGDISSERGELEQAAEWYELALDIVPDHEETKAKLESVRSELANRQTQSTVQSLGIPQKQPPIALYALIGVVIAAFAIAAVVMANRKNDVGPDPNKPIILKNDKPGPRVETPAVDNKDDQAPVYKENEELAGKIAEEVKTDRTITASVSDPGGSVRVRLHGVGEDGEWPLRAKIALATFKLQSDAPKVEVEYYRPDGKAETLIVDRAAYEKTQAADFDQTDEALLVLTLFGHTMEPTNEKPNPDGTPNNTITPPVGQGGEGSSEGTSTGGQ